MPIIRYQHSCKLTDRGISRLPVVLGSKANNSVRNHVEDIAVPFREQNHRQSFKARCLVRCYRRDGSRDPSPLSRLCQVLPETQRFSGAAVRLLMASTFARLLKSAFQLRLDTQKFL
jgi:hypothetical protein